MMPSFHFLSVRELESTTSNRRPRNLQHSRGATPKTSNTFSIEKEKGKRWTKNNSSDGNQRGEQRNRWPGAAVADLFRWRHNDATEPDRSFVCARIKRIEVENQQKKSAFRKKRTTLDNSVKRWATGRIFVRGRADGFNWVSMGFIGFYWVSMGFTGFQWVLLSFTGFQWV